MKEFIFKFCITIVASAFFAIYFSGCVRPRSYGIDQYPKPKVLDNVLLNRSNLLEVWQVNFD